MSSKKNKIVAKKNLIKVEPVTDNQKIAFEELNLHKLFVYAFDLRPHLYIAVEKSGYKKEAILKEHCLFDGKYIDVVIHSKIIEI